MQRFRPICLASILSWASLYAGTASAQQSDDIVVTAHHINPVRDARTPWDEIQNCYRDRICTIALNGIAAQFGIPPNAMRLVNGAAIMSARPQGEETRYSISALSGRKICQVQVRTTSVVPATGDRASLFSITATQPSVAIYTWTPRQGIGQGRSWYDGVVFVVQVRAELSDQYAASGKCTVPQSGTSANYQCRGSSGVNHGLAACGSKNL